MRKITITILATFCCLVAKPQNEFDIKCHIKESMERFWDLLSSVNDDENPVSTKNLASEYRGSNYFYLNGKEADFEEFLSSYSKKDLGNKMVNHKLAVSKDNISKTSSTKSDHRYTVKGRLEREFASGGDILIKDEMLTATVLFDGFEDETRILELKFSKTLQAVRPKNVVEYEFTLDRSKSIVRVPYTGGKWKIAVLSHCRNVKKYPGIEGNNSYGVWKPASYVHSANIKYSIDAKSQTLTGSLGANHSRRPRSYCVSMTQDATHNVIKQYVEQAGRPRRLFDYETTVYDQVDVLYSIRYNIGLSYMHIFDDGRLSLGLLVALNNDFFRGWEWADSERVTPEASIDKSMAITGYRMTVSTINPEEDNYSELLDPWDEAKNYTSRTLLLAQAGINLSQWMRFDLGVGAASAKELHFMEEAYALDVYSYERTKQSLPVRGDKYVYRKVYENYYYKDKATWYCAVRPALVFNIPLDSDFEKSISVGAGYTFAIGCKDAGSPDFSVGIRLEY